MVKLGSSELLGGDGEVFLTGHGALRGRGELGGAHSGPGDLGGGRSHELGGGEAGRHLDGLVFGGRRRIYNEERRTRDAHTQEEEEVLEGWLWGK